MSTPSRPKPTILDQLQEALKEVAAFNVQRLVRLDTLGRDFHFADAGSEFEAVLRLLAELRAGEVARLPKPQQPKVLAGVNNLLSAFTRIEAFSPKVENPGGAHAAVLKAFRDAVAAHSETLTAAVAYLASTGAPTQRLAQDAGAARAEIHRLTVEARHGLTARMAEADSLLASIRELAQQGGVSKHAGRFGGQADKHVRMARWWLWSSGVMAFVTSGFAFWFLWGLLPHGPAEANVQAMGSVQAIELGVAKLVFLSILMSATVFAARTYQSHRHNEVVNRHRQHALDTFEAFVQSAADQATKGAVLLQATQCVFAAQPTAYAGSDVAPGPSTDFTSFVRAVAEAKK
jgi:hypothetical protein